MIYQFYQTPLGALCGVADDRGLVYLKFHDDTAYDIAMIEATLGTVIARGSNQVLQLLATELEQYFQARLREFSIPLVFCVGTPFQKKTWQALQAVGYGATASYKALAQATGQDKAFRAVGRANGANNHVIVVPCHRIIQANGTLGGYSQGLQRKQWLLQHEQREK